MNNLKYSNAFKKEICILICEKGTSTKETAKRFNVPLKTVEKWVTAYHKDSKFFNRPDDYYEKIQKRHTNRYNALTRAELISELKKRDGEIAVLKTTLERKREV